MSTASAKRVARPKSSPVYLRLEKLIREETGEFVKGFVAMTKWDARVLAERKYHIGTEVRAELKKPRNGKFHRLTHAIGALLVDNVEGFESLNSHEALKRVQREADVCCETVETDAAPIVAAVLAAAEAVLDRKAIEILADALPAIKKINERRPLSIAYDQMEEGQFAELFAGVTRYIDEHYAPDLMDEVRDEYDRMVVGGG